MHGGGPAQRASGDTAPLAALLAQCAFGVAELDLAGGRVLAVSPGLAELLGGDAAHPSARQLLLFAGPADAAAPPTTRVTLRRSDDTFAPVRLARIDLGGGRALLLVGEAARDGEAAQAAESYREIYDNISEGVYRSSVDGHQLTANPALVRLNGYDSEAEMLRAVADIAIEWYVEPGRRAEFARLMEADGRVEDFVSEIYRHKTRERIWISENARLVRDRRSGAALYYEGTIRDVTETVRRLQVEQRLRTIVETIADGVVTTDAGGGIRSANRAAEVMFAAPPGSLVGQRLAALVSEADAGPLRLAPGRERRAEGIRPDGSRFPLDLTIAEAADQAAPMLICCLSDATDRLRYEAGLQDAKDAAERANRAKSDFLAVMSHELRTPLNAVIGMTGLLLDSGLDDRSRRHTETLRQAADHLLTLINDVLDFSKLDATRLELEAIAFDVEHTLHGALDLLAPRAHAKGIEICAYTAPEVPALLIGDPGRLRQVLINLVGNAIKFTERGAVVVELAVGRDGDDGGVELTFEVQDSGIGIAAEHLPLLFKEFSQADSSVSRRFGGTGLGLAICARLVAGMGGAISVTSTPGQGSVFRFSIRLRRGSGPAAAPPRLDGRRILVVDDEAVNRGIFARQLEARGAVVVAVADGAAALMALGGAEPFDAALIDHAMPAMDGATLARALRAAPAFAALRLVLATSSVASAIARAAAEAVFDAVLTKPVPVDALVRALRGAGGYRSPPPAAPVGGARTLRILVAEDNAANQLVVRAMLERLGHQPDIVGNGLAAVAAVRDRPYDIVLMDVMMPGLDGIEATRLIRKLPAPAGTCPVLGLTAHVAPEDHAAFRAAGMDSVLTKPITATALAAALAPLAASTPPPAWGTPGT